MSSKKIPINKSLISFVSSGCAVTVALTISVRQSVLYPVQGVRHTGSYGIGSVRRFGSVRPLPTRALG